MSVQLEDRTTMDMFAERQRGRPKSNPYPRDVQIRVNKRTQRLRDKKKGLRRLEVKMSEELIQRLDEYAAEQKCTRAEVVEMSVEDWLKVVLDQASDQTET